RESRSLRGLFLPVPWVDVRHGGAHPAGTGAAEPASAGLQIYVGDDGRNRLRGVSATMSFSWARPYEPKHPAMRWIDERLPLPRLVYGAIGGGYPVPRNLNYWWSFGVLAGIFLTIQIVTGIVLAMHFTASTDGAFNSVNQLLMRDVNAGWLLRYAHMNGASFFFLVTYIHIFRGLYYGSYKAPRELV